MGGREDVNHGSFVHAGDGGHLARPPIPAPPPPFPRRALHAAQTARHPPANDPAAKPVNSEALQSLLAAIQQDLKSVA